MPFFSAFLPPRCFPPSLHLCVFAYVCTCLFGLAEGRWWVFSEDDVGASRWTGRAGIISLTVKC